MRIKTKIFFFSILHASRAQIVLEIIAIYSRVCYLSPKFPIRIKIEIVTKSFYYIKLSV